MSDTNLSSLRLGNAGLPPDSRLTSQPPGALTSPVYVYSVTPAATSLTAIAAAQTVSGGAFTVSGGAGTTTTSIGGVSYIDLGVDRNITASGASTVVTVADITVSGLDRYFAPVTVTFSGPSSTALTSSIKTMRYVRGAATAGNTTSGVSLGSGDVLGFPYRVNSPGSVVSTWNGDKITTSVGFSAAVTTAATAFTGDTRGTQLVTPATDGTRKFTSFIWAEDPDTVTGLYGVVQA